MITKENKINKISELNFEIIKKVTSYSLYLLE